MTIRKTIRSTIRRPYYDLVKPVSLLNLLPSNFASTFNVDTISADLTWTDASSGSAVYEVYSSTNGGAETLLTTTAAGAESYSDATCKQNASVVYRIRGKRGGSYSEFVTDSALATPLCWKTNQSVLTEVNINRINVADGKTVTVNWGDGTSEALTGSTTDKKKNYAATGQYNIWLSGDTDSIMYLSHHTQSKSSGSIANWILPKTLTNFAIYLTSLSGSVSGWILPAGLVYLGIRDTSLSGSVSGWILPAGLTIFYINNTSISGSLPQITIHETTILDYRAHTCNFSDSNVTVFRKAMSVFNVGTQKVTFSTANIDKLLKAIADWYEVNAPTANCTFTMDGANMGIPTGGVSNTDLVRTVGYYTAAGKTATFVIRTS